MNNEEFTAPAPGVSLRDQPQAVRTQRTQRVKCWYKQSTAEITGISAVQCKDRRELVKNKKKNDRPHRIVPAHNYCVDTPLNFCYT